MVTAELTDGEPVDVTLAAEPKDTCARETSASRQHLDVHSAHSGVVPSEHSRPGWRRPPCSAKAAISEAAAEWHDLATSHAEQTPPRAVIRSRPKAHCQPSGSCRRALGKWRHTAAAPPTGSGDWTGSRCPAAAVADHHGSPGRGAPTRYRVSGHFRQSPASLPGSSRGRALQPDARPVKESGRIKA